VTHQQSVSPISEHHTGIDRASRAENAVCPRIERQDRTQEFSKMNQMIRNTEQETNMSLDHTSHPGGRGPDELVPSRYVQRVGDIDVLVVSDGVLPLPTAMLTHTPTRRSGRPGWTTCTCQRMLSTGR
jgi:hypothetical protein